jgi:hypothetical protein
VICAIDCIRFVFVMIQIKDNYIRNDEKDIRCCTQNESL